MTRRYFRISGQEGVYSSYEEVRKQARMPHERIEVYCLNHGWADAMADGGCIECERERWGLTAASLGTI